MSAATDPEAARGELEPDDVVGNALCDLLLEAPNPAVIRVLNYHGNWAEAVPQWTDFRQTLDSCQDVVLRFPAPDMYGNTVLVRASNEVGRYERVAVDGDTTLGHVSEASAALIESLVESRGGPELVPFDDVQSHFLDGDLP